MTQYIHTYSNLINACDFVTRENFKVEPTLNETFEKIYDYNPFYHCIFNDKPNNGFWLSPTDSKDGSSIWRNQIILEQIQKLAGENNELALKDAKTVTEQDIINHGYNCDIINYLKRYVNSYASIYTLKDANILKVILDDADSVKDFYQKYYKWHRTGYELNTLNTVYKNLSMINEFIDNNNLNRKIQERDPTLKGIRIIENSENDDKFFTIKNKNFNKPIVGIVSAKKTSKTAMIQSCNELIANCEKYIDWILNSSSYNESCYSYIDWEHIRNDGFDGVEFIGNDKAYQDVYCYTREEYFLSKIHIFNNSIVVWKWCFEDNVEFVKFDDVQT